MKGVSTLVDAFLGLPAWHSPPSGPHGRTSINYTRQLSQPASAGELQLANSVSVSGKWSLSLPKKKKNYSEMAPGKAPTLSDS